MRSCPTAPCSSWQRQLCQDAERVRFVERPVTIAFDGGARSVTVTGLAPSVQVAAEASQVP